MTVIPMKEYEELKQHKLESERHMNIISSRVKGYIERFEENPHVKYDILFILNNLIK